MTTEVVQEASNVGLALLTLLAHTSHVLQALDVLVFKLFEQYFREYRDFGPVGMWMNLLLELSVHNGYI